MTVNDSDNLRMDGSGMDCAACAQGPGRGGTSAGRHGGDVGIMTAAAPDLDGRPRAIKDRPHDLGSAIPPDPPLRRTAPRVSRPRAEGLAHAHSSTIIPTTTARPFALTADPGHAPTWRRPRRRALVADPEGGGDLHRRCLRPCLGPASLPGPRQWPFVAACLIGVAPIARRAFAALRLGMPFTIEMLMTIAAVGALVIGAAEEAALVVFLFAVGEVLEGVAAEPGPRRSGRSATWCRRRRCWRAAARPGSTEPTSLEIGQTVLVRPGDRVPADGEILEGISGIDESPVTGESVPSTKGPGEPVFAGSINTEAALHVRVTTRASDNTIARIIRLVEEAQEAPRPDRAVHRPVQPLVHARGRRAGGPRRDPAAACLRRPGRPGSTAALALLLIGCPCALVISVPASIASALSAGARRGLLMKGGAVIEAAALTDVVDLRQDRNADRRPAASHRRGGDLGGTRGGGAGAGGRRRDRGRAIRLPRRSCPRRKLRAFRPGRDRRPGAPGPGRRSDRGGEAVFVGSPRYAEELGVVDDPRAMERMVVLEEEGKTVVAVFRAWRSWSG